MHIDVHSHFFSPNYMKRLAQRRELPYGRQEKDAYIFHCCPGLSLPAIPVMVNMEEKFAAMEQLGIDAAILTAGVPGPELAGGREADELARIINDDLAEILQRSQEKFWGFGSVGFGDADSSIREIDRCVNELGFRGIQIFANINGKPLDSEEFRPIYRHMAQLDLPMFMHPTVPLNRAFVDSPSLLGGIGFMFDTTLNTMRMVKAGVWDELPELKLIVPHIGGVFPYLLGRLDAFEHLHYDQPSAMPRPPSAYLKNIYVDTVAYDQEALDHCYRVLGAEHMVYGTDHPYARFDLPAALIDQLPCTQEEKDAIFAGNIRRLVRTE